jgi:diacylglycerol kinase (ATP)
MLGVRSPFGSLAVIVNPRAGEGRVHAEIPALERNLSSHGLDHRILITSGPGDATRFAAAALDEGHRFLVAVGGDGTVQEVVNGMFRGGRTIVDEPVLGVVAANSGCDLVRSFGLPGDTDAACSHLLGDNTYPFDVMKITCTRPDGERVVRYSHNLAEAGLGGEVARRNARVPRGARKARRFIAFWSAYARTRTWKVTVDADKGSYEGPAFNVVVANGQFTSGGVRLSPRSFPGDGILDALVFHGARSNAYTMLPKLFRHGDHIPDPDIAELRAKLRVAVDADRPLPIVADGEMIGTTPATFQVVPRQILVKL